MTESRKVVTVVFTDVTDSTALGEQLDPESLRHVLSRYFEEMQDGDRAPWRARSRSSSATR